MTTRHVPVPAVDGRSDPEAPDETPGPAGISRRSVLKVVGMGADGYATWKIGRYADRELLPRAKR